MSDRLRPFVIPALLQMHRLLGPVLVLALGVTAMAGGGLPATAQARWILDTKGGPACRVSPPASSSRTPGADRLVIDIRVPDAPDSPLLVRLPPQKRDYSALPIAVFLVPAPAKGQRVSAKLPQVTPLVADLAPRSVDGAPSGDTFIRVEYARAHLTAGLDLVAERTAVADSGEKITTQTRCRIGAGDVSAWK